MKIRIFTALLAVWTASCAVSFGAVVYDNSTNYLGFSHDSTLEYGDEIVLGGSERWITEFAFEYFASFTETGDETARLRFYANDGPLGANATETPGTVLYDSGIFDISTGYRTVHAEGLGFEVPDRFTWTVEFSGLAEGERAGLLFYDPPGVGSSEPDFWQKEDGAWHLLEFPSLVANFAAQVTATNVPVQTVEILSVTVQNGVATIQASATPGRYYTLEYIGAVGQPWRRTATPRIQADATTITLQDPQAWDPPNRFYRVKETLTTIEESEGQLVISAHATPGTAYKLQTSTDFSSWNDVPGQATAESDEVSFSVPMEGSMLFYRIVPVTG